MPTIITGIRRRKPFVGSPRRAAAVVSARPPVRPIVATQVRRPLVGRGTVGRPAKLAVQIVAKRPPAVLVAAPRRIVQVLSRGIVGRPTRAIAVPSAMRVPGVLVARARRAAPVPGRGLVLRGPARVIAPPVVRWPLPALVARVAFARPFFVRTGPIPGPLRLATPPEPEPGAPGGTWRRPGWSWARVFRRPAASWDRVWRYRPVSATRIPPATLAKPASEPRWFAVSLAETPEVVAGETLSAPELLPAGGPPGLTISGLVVLDAEFDRIPIGRGVKFFIDGGTAGATYNFAVRVAASGGGKPVVPCKLVVTPDFDSP